jgi:hypothetical protein
MRSVLCDAQIPDPDPTVAAPSAEQTGMLWVPYHRLYRAGMSAQKTSRLATGDVCDASGVVAGAGSQGSVIGGPLKIEYPVIVNGQVDSIWLWQTKLCKPGSGVRTVLTNLVPTPLASKCPKRTLCLVRWQRPEGARHHVSRLTAIRPCGSYAYVI